MERVLRAASRLQQIVPDAVLVGGAAAVHYAGHRLTFDADHVLSDLSERFEQVLDAVESVGDWVTNRVVPGKVILGALGGIETGIRQMRRRRPLEVEEVVLDDGSHLRVPTLPETLRIKAFLIVVRNKTRDYLDVAALSERLGVAEAAGVLACMDEYYEDQSSSPDGVASQVLRQLGDPRPVDTRTLRRLADYKGLDARWHDWRAVEERLAHIAQAMLLSSQVDTAGEVPVVEATERAQLDPGSRSLLP